MRDAVTRRLRRLVATSRQVYREYRRLNVGFMAGSVAYQGFMSLLPLFVVLYLLVTALVGPRYAAEVLATSERVLPPEAHGLLAGAVTSETPTNATVVSVVVLLWGSLGLFTTLETAFATIYGTGHQVRRVTEVVDALVALSVVFLATILAVASAGVGLLSRVPGLGAGSSALLFVGLVLAFFPMYYLFPNTEIPPGDALVGAVIAAVGWTVLQGLFQLYLRYVASGDIPGLLGTVLLLLTWLYFGSYVLLLAAIVNATIAGAGES